MIFSLKETLLTQATLAQNAQRALKLLNDLPGISCQPAIGGIYLYPHLDLPPEFRRQAKVRKGAVDVATKNQVLYIFFRKKTTTKSTASEKYHVNGKWEGTHTM